MYYQFHNPNNYFVHEPKIQFESLLIKQWASIEPGSQFLSLSGQSIMIINRGDLNNYDGPDFLNAIVIIDGRIRNGSIECHVDASDWYKHGHEKNDRYGDVILHVVYSSSKNGKIPSIPTVKLLEHSNTIDKCKFPQDIPDYTIVEILRKFADQRWKFKVEQYSGLHDVYQQLLAKLIDESFTVLGASGNKENFRILSKNIELDTVTHFSSSELKKYLVQLSIDLDIDWNTKSVRPAHQPLNRMGLATELIKFFIGLIGRPSIEYSDIIKELQASCTSVSGRGIQIEIIGNVILPYIASKNIYHKRHDQYKDNYITWHKLKLPTPYQKYVKRFNQKIDKATLKLFYIMQGAIQLDKIWCGEKMCNICPLKNIYDNN